MSHRVTALYPDSDKARLAAGDLTSAGVAADRIVLMEGRITIFARDYDHAINVKSFLEEDGALWTEIGEGKDDAVEIQSIPPVPAP